MDSICLCSSAARLTTVEKRNKSQKVAVLRIPEISGRIAGIGRVTACVTGSRPSLTNVGANTWDLGLLHVKTYRRDISR